MQQDQLTFAVIIPESQTGTSQRIGIQHPGVIVGVMLSVTPIAYPVDIGYASAFVTLDNKAQATNTPTVTQRHIIAMHEAGLMRLDDGLNFPGHAYGGGSIFVPMRVRFDPAVTALHLRTAKSEIDARCGAIVFFEPDPLEVIDPEEHAALFSDDPQDSDQVGR